MGLLCLLLGVVYFSLGQEELNMVLRGPLCNFDALDERFQLLNLVLMASVVFVKNDGFDQKLVFWPHNTFFFVFGVLVALVEEHLFVR